MKEKQLDRAKNLLGQALSVAHNAMPNHKGVAEARRDMQRAIKKLDQVSKKQGERKKMMQDQHQNWWGNIEAGAASLAASPMSPETQMRTLSQLDAMIEAEKEKLRNLEKHSQETDDQTDSQMFNE